MHAGDRQPGTISLFFNAGIFPAELCKLSRAANIFSVDTAPTLSPDCVSCCSAIGHVRPTKFGTARASAASMITRSIAVPSGTELPMSGEFPIRFVATLGCPSDDC